jgi:hypothetical protein
MRADHIYREAGFTLAYIQFADKCIASALKLAFPGSATHTLDTIERNKRVLAKATLGTLIRILSERVELHPDFERELTAYCEDRNSFVHDWDRINQWDDDGAASDYMTQLQKRAAWLVSIFVEVIRQWSAKEGIAPESMKKATDEGLFEAIDGPWLDDLDLMFPRVK